MYVGSSLNYSHCSLCFHFPVSRDWENHRNASKPVSMPAHTLLSMAQQLVKHLPVAHRELAQQLAGSVRPHTTVRSFRDNLALVATPLLSSSVFSTLSVEVQFLAFYFLIAMITVDLFRPRLTYNRPSSRVSVLDALGKYHDFPWSACANPKVCRLELNSLRSPSTPDFFDYRLSTQSFSVVS